MKNIIIAILGVMLAFLMVGKIYSGNAEKIATYDWWGSLGDVQRVRDGNTTCYIAIASTNGVAISCVRVK